VVPLSCGEADSHVPAGATPFLFASACRVANMVQYAPLSPMVTQALGPAVVFVIPFGLKWIHEVEAGALCIDSEASAQPYSYRFSHYRCQGSYPQKNTP
jgi:hypothetical protein